jgi:hypothetical protein
MLLQLETPYTQHHVGIIEYDTTPRAKEGPMLKYKKSRNIDEIEVILDGRQLIITKPSVGRVMYFVVEYIDTLKYMPSHFDVDKMTAGVLSNLIIQSFCDIFRDGSMEMDSDVRQIYERITKLTQHMLDSIEELVTSHNTLSEEKLKEVAKTFVPAALIKLQNGLFNDLVV